MAVYLFFDTETTGLPRNYKAPVEDLDNWPRMVQIAWHLYDESGHEIQAKNYIIKPDGFTIPDEASKVHGITNERAFEEGVPLTKALGEFQESLHKTGVLVCHNLDFDQKIVQAEFLREKVDFDLFGKPGICTMKSSTDYCKIPGPYGYKWPRLQELYNKLFNSSFDEAHDAAADVGALVECFFELKRKGIIRD